MMYLISTCILISVITLTDSRTIDDPLPPPPQPTSSSTTTVVCPTIAPLPAATLGLCACNGGKLECQGDLSEESLNKTTLCGTDVTGWSLRATNISNLGFLPEPCHLDMLDVSHNRITSIEGSLSTCKGLWLLEMSHNPIGGIPERLFEKMSKLGYLFLQSAELRRVDEETFLGLHSLFSLNLSNNLLTHIPQNAFKDLWNIDVIDLSNNRLLLLPDLLFRKTLRLRFLLLNGNRITHIQSGLFAGLQHLHYLNLSHNQISFLQSDIFEGLPRFSRLDAQHNVIQEIPVFRNCCTHMDYADFRRNRIMSPRVETIKTMLRLAGFGILDVDMRDNPVTRAALCRLLRAGGSDACDRHDAKSNCLRGRLGRCRPSGGCYWLKIHEDGCKATEKDWRWDYEFDDRK